MAEIDLKEKFPRMTPAKVPPLFRLNGCGVALYGNRDRDAETGTYVSTLCVCIVFIPLLCLKAYRVAKADGEWRFFGREPLSAMAKAWNILLLAAIFVSTGTWSYKAYTGSPAYKTQHQMAEAHHLVDAGHLGDAARIYQALVIAESDQAANATAAITDLLNNRCEQAPLSESAGVFAVAAQIARHSQTLGRSDIADKGLKLVADKGDADPRSAVALLDAIRPLVTDTQPIDVRRLALLRKWAGTEPNNVDAIAQLASVLAEQGQTDDAKKLLLPMKDRLGNGEGARVLGMILAREGDYDGASNLLGPYVQSRLDKLHAAERVATATENQLWNREVKVLNQEKGPPDFYERYKNASKDDQPGIVRDYINGRTRNDPRLLSAHDALERESAVVPVAMELGRVMLQRAQRQSNPDVRKAQLESAEQVFLAISGQAGQSDAYRLALGQVYYSLGKQAEGAKLFDDFLAGKGHTVRELLMIATKLRGWNPSPKPMP